MAIFSLNLRKYVYEISPEIQKDLDEMTMKQMREQGCSEELISRRLNARISWEPSAYALSRAWLALIRKSEGREGA